MLSHIGIYKRLEVFYKRLKISFNIKAGGSLGTVFAWDRRWPQQPAVLSKAGTGEEATSHLPVESDVWEVQYDPYAHTSNISSGPSSRVLPVMICSEDGFLAVVEQGILFICYENKTREKRKN